MIFCLIWFYEDKDKDNQNDTDVRTIPFPRHCFLLRCCLWQLLEYIITCNSCRIFALMCFREWYIAHFLFAILPLAPHQRRTNNHRLSEHFFSFSSNFFPISSWTSLSFAGVNKSPQKFIFAYLFFSQKLYLNVWCFEKIHICIPKIQNLHT